MKMIKASTPAADGFHMPAEYERHEGCIMIFPERADSWQYGGYAARRAFVQVAEAIAESEQVTVCASEAQYDNARALLPPHIRVVEMSSNDAWARNYGPTFVTNGQGEVRGIDWGFNAWGDCTTACISPGIRITGWRGSPVTCWTGTCMINGILFWKEALST